MLNRPKVGRLPFRWRMNKGVVLPRNRGMQVVPFTSAPSLTGCRSRFSVLLYLRARLRFMMGRSFMRCCASRNQRKPWVPLNSTVRG